MNSSLPAVRSVKRTSPNLPSMAAAIDPLSKPSDFHVYLPRDVAEIPSGVAPAEVVDPSSHARVHDLLDHLRDRHVQAPSHHLPEAFEKSVPLLLLGSGQGHLLAGIFALVDPAERVPQKVERLSSAEVHRA